MTRSRRRAQQSPSLSLCNKLHRPPPGPGPRCCGATRGRCPCAAALARGKSVCAAHSGPLRGRCCPGAWLRCAPPLPPASVPSGAPPGASRGGPRPGSLAPPIGPGRARCSGGSCPPASSLRAVLRPVPARAQVARGVAPVALAWLRAPFRSPCARCGLPPPPAPAPRRRGPPPAAVRPGQRRPRCCPGLRLRCACPRSSRRGACGGAAPRFLRPPAPRRLWGLGCAAAAALHQIGGSCQGSGQAARGP